MLAANDFFGLLGRTGRDLPGNIEPTQENLKAYEQGVDVRNNLSSMSLEDAKNDDSTASSIIFILTTCQIAAKYKIKKMRYALLDFLIRRCGTYPTT